MISYLIVDDEPLAHEIIEEFCRMLPHLELKGNCFNAMEGMEFLNSKKVDIMFLDLNMPNLSGFDFLRTLTNPPNVIVTTAHKEFALDGFQLNVVDYLLKPFSFDRLVQAVNKAIDRVGSKSTGSIKQTASQRFFIKGENRYHQISTNEIQFIEGYGNYTKVMLQDQMIISHHNISYYEQLLSDHDFLRVHRSFIVALDKIKEVAGNTIMINDHPIPIGQTYRSTVGKLLK